MRVAVVHDWLTGMRGGERVLESVLRLYPDAELFTLLHVRGSVSSLIESRPIHTSYIGKLPFVSDRYRYYLPLFPHAIQRLRPRGFDLVISISHCVAKGIPVERGVAHVCYCNTPMRYIWEHYDDYFGPGRASAAVRLAMPAVASRLRKWDVASNSGVSSFVANSGHIRSRIERLYHREAGVIYPPVDVARFQPGGRRESFYLIVSALVPYKRVDLAIAAFNTLDRPLVIAGDGPERARLQAMASSNISFTGRVSDEEITDLMQRCRAFIFPGTEDFGITAVEAQAAGAPVIAHASGGALESVTGSVDHVPPGATGVFFSEQSPESLRAAVLRFEANTFAAAVLRANAFRFDVPVFERCFREHVERVLAAG